MRVGPSCRDDSLAMRYALRHADSTLKLPSFLENELNAALYRPVAAVTQFIRWSVSMAVSREIDLGVRE